MSLKKKVLTTLSLVLILGLAALGILAYLTDTDSDVNVMTLGNVKIEQHEYERVVDANGNYATDTIDNQTSYVLKDFTQGKALLPSALNTTTWEGWGWNDDVAVVRNSQVGSYGGMSVFKDAANAQDKFVYVENTGETDAYVRTLVAIEVGSADPSLIGTSYHQTWTKKDPIYRVEIAGNNYNVYEYVYAGGQLSDGSWRHKNGILPAGDMTYNSFAQVYLNSKATNEDMVKIDGNGNGKLDILVLSQAVQAEGFENAQIALDTAFGTVRANAAEWFLGVLDYEAVATADELQDAIEDGTTEIVLTDDIAGDVVVPQSADTEITIEGNGHDFAGVLTVDGKSGTITTAGLTIKDVNFKADSINEDACIQLGDGTNATRYTCNVTVEGCTFDVPGAVGVKSYTGGDKNLVIRDCIATANAHSLAQLKGIDGVLIDNCTVNSVRGVNFNNSLNVTVANSTFDVQKYALRFGESNNTVVEQYTIKNCTLESQNVDDDAAIVFRAGATNAEVTRENVTIFATIKYSGHDSVNFIDK